jgi:hypothetical protein
MVARSFDTVVLSDPEQVARQEMLRLYGIKYLKKLLHVDATPPADNEKISSEIESKYQKRRWFGHVLMSFNTLLPEITDQRLRQKIEIAKAGWTSEEFTLRSRLTKKKDIDLADKLIIEVLAYFEKLN